MKLTILLLFLININSESLINEKKIIGEWLLIKTAKVEKNGELLSRVETGYLDDIIIDFKPNYTATIESTDRKIKDQITWKVIDKTIELTYSGENIFLNLLNGQFQVKFNGKRKMVFYNKLERREIFFEK